MVITEIFASIQGESTWAGQPCIFVRLTGCNLRCRWCDTEYAFHGGERKSVEEVLAEVQTLSGQNGCRTKLVELTGGEPMLQTEIYSLIEKLLAEEFTVLVETSGERYLGDLPELPQRFSLSSLSGALRTAYFVLHPLSATSAFHCDLCFSLRPLLFTATSAVNLSCEN